MDISSIQDPRYISVVRDLGGYSKLITESIATVTDALAANPRFERMRSSLLLALDRRIPTMREHVQLQLARMSWDPKPASSYEVTNTLKPRPITTSRFPLGDGTHFEIELRHPRLKWRGVADLVQLHNQQCTIKDFKTGEQSNDHLLQLQIYALLWLHDDELNPAQIPVTKLALCYPNEEREIAYTTQEVMSLSETLPLRTDTVRKAVVGASSQANLSAEHCPKCDVRHLCSNYWSNERPPIQNQEATNDSQFDDIQLSLEFRKGQNTWSAKCRRSNHVPIGTLVLLRWTPNDCDVLEQLSPGATIRLTGAFVSRSADSDLTTVTCLTTTDLIVLPYSSDAKD